MMTSWTYLFVVLISFTCVAALPTRAGESEDEEEKKEDRLLFEPKKGGEDKQGKVAPPGKHQQEEAIIENTAAWKKAVEEKIGRETPKDHGEIGSLGGEALAHGAHEGDLHGKVPEEKAIKHVDTGALGEDFLHNVMHDGEENHEEADKQLLKERPAEIGDVAKMNFDKESLKQFKEDAFKDPDPTDKKFDNQDHGPKRPDKALHGVLMHGDQEAGKDHSHEDQVKKEDKPRGEDTVRIGRVDKTAFLKEEEKVARATPNTVDTEQLLHGAGKGHVHDHAAPKGSRDDGVEDGVLDENFMHNLMHGGLEKHEHDDSRLKKEKAIRPRDLENLGLDKSLLKGLDLKKMIQDDMEEYNKFISEKGGDDDSMWNIFNSFQFRYFKNGEDIDDISSRQPVDEWDDSVITPVAKGDDGINHKHP
ncbi:uncharacterized protein LOC124266774 [Haliotis rubra]|uniref:uncharacterized protein LOC124266774 n=1 Tax=Haliotis rubra TaxID=36100 RepID=UPI001EE5B1D7|nr:uncharacterized protein LOC124266774 [Haliotis rubra]